MHAITALSDSLTNQAQPSAPTPASTRVTRSQTPQAPRVPEPTVTPPRVPDTPTAPRVAPVLLPQSISPPAQEFPFIFTNEDAASDDHLWDHPEDEDTLAFPDALAEVEDLPEPIVETPAVPPPVIPPVAPPVIPPVAPPGGVPPYVSQSGRTIQPNSKYQNHIGQWYPQANSAIVHSYKAIGRNLRYYAAAAVGADSTRTTLSYKQAIKGPCSAQWEEAAVQEFVRLLTTTGTGHFIHPHSKPKDRLSSYYNPQCTTKVKGGSIVYRVRGTYGGDRSDYYGDTAAWTADLQTVKILLNAVASETNPTDGLGPARFMTADISDFYLGSPLERAEYMTIRRDQIPLQIQERYKDTLIFVGDSAMMELTKAIYGLPQAGKLAQQDLIAHLKLHGYIQCNTTCLFRHASRPTFFSLVVDDFGIKYRSLEDAKHLLDTLKLKYKITEDWEGSRYLGLHIKHDLTSGKIHLSLPNYVEQALTRLGVKKLAKDTDNPDVYSPINYGQREQEAISMDTSALLDAARTKRIQVICGIFLFYARAIDPTMLRPILRIASRQAKPTEQLERDVDHFLQYCATHPDATQTILPSEMILVVHSDASHLSESLSRSRAGGFHFLTNKADIEKPPVNAPIDVISTIIDAVVRGADEAEYAAFYLNGHLAESSRITLEDLGYKQAPTPIIGDNSAACSTAKGTNRPKRSKVILQKYHWVRYRVHIKNFRIIWQEGKANKADYFTKTQSPQIHRQRRPELFPDFKIITANPYQLLAPGEGVLAVDA